MSTSLKGDTLPISAKDSPKRLANSPICVARIGGLATFAKIIGESAMFCGGFCGEDSKDVPPCLPAGRDWQQRRP